MNMRFSSRLGGVLADRPAARAAGPRVVCEPIVCQNDRTQPGIRPLLSAETGDAALFAQ
jgi:hypothetical protein